MISYENRLLLRIKPGAGIFAIGTASNAGQVQSQTVRAALELTFQRRV
jgi:hypothetical protein